MLFRFVSKRICRLLPKLMFFPIEANAYKCVRRDFVRENEQTKRSDSFRVLNFVNGSFRRFLSSAVRICRRLVSDAEKEYFIRAMRSIIRKAGFLYAVFEICIFFGIPYACVRFRTFLFRDLFCNAYSQCL